MEEFLASSEQDFVDFKSSLLMEDTAGDPIKRANVINEIADTVADIPDAVKRETYIDFLSRKFDIRRDALEDRVGATRAKNIIAERKAAERVHPRSQSRVEGSQQNAEGGSLVQEGESFVPVGEPAEPRPGIDSRVQGGDFSSSLARLEENKIMAKAERDLLNFILTYGTTTLEFQSDSEFYADSEDERRTVFDFISQALEEDDAHFSNSVYKATYDAYADDYYDGYAQDEIVKHLLDGPDRNIAYVVSQLSMTEVYELTIKNLRDAMMSRGSWLTKFVPKAILVFQSCRLEDKENSLKQELAQAQKEADSGRILTVMNELIEIRKTMKAVKVRLGREK